MMRKTLSLKSEQSNRGGDEAAIFAGDLLRMYSKYAESQNFKTEIVEVFESDHGGYKEISFSVSVAVLIVN